METCSVEGCERPKKSWGMCPLHYARTKRHGDPHTVTRIRASGPPEVRFWAHVNRRGPEECWPWTGGLSEGYGHFAAVNGKSRGAHIWVYEHEVGLVPKGLILDHTCHNRALACLGGPKCLHRRCVNPAHLEPATNQQNVSRGAGPRILIQRGKERTTCDKGHPYPPDVRRNASNGRLCPTCQKGYARAWYLRSIGASPEPS